MTTSKSTDPLRTKPAQDSPGPEVKRLQFALALAFNDAAEWPRLARAAEEAGFGGLIVSDHLAYPEHLETPYPYTKDGKPRWEPETAWPDPLIAVAAMAAQTERIRFLLSVFVLPLRHPVVAAKQLATAAVFAPGRMIVTVGAGWMREEFDLVGAPFARRGARMLESVEIMKKLWTGEFVAHRGEFFDIPSVKIAPTPPIDIPVWGGGTSDIAIRRAAQHFDGWSSEIQSSSDVYEFIDRLKALRQEAGREDQDFGICVATRDVYTLDGYRSLEAAGVTDLITVPWALYGQFDADLDAKCEAIKRFGLEVIDVF